MRHLLCGGGRLAVLVPLVLIACRAEQRSSPLPEKCEAGVPAGMPPFDTTRVEQLAGSYALVMVGDNETARSYRRAGRLTIWVQDSVRRRHSRIGPLSPRDERPLAAAFERQPVDASDWWRIQASRDLDRPGGIYWRGRLRLGQIDVIDGGGDELTILNADDSGFRGIWRTDLGIAVIMDTSTGRILPNPAGHFCARRLKSGQ